MCEGLLGVIVRGDYATDHQCSPSLPNRLLHTVGMTTEDYQHPA